MHLDTDGFFVTIEGPDGSGKSTQLKLLSKHLESINCKHMVTRDPGGTAIGKQIRHILLRAETPVGSMTELLLYEADRAQHIYEVIEPALKAGYLVLCDRYIDSTRAYQGYGRGIDLKLIDQLNEIATKGLKPDMTILFDIDSEIGLSRLHPGGRDRLEREALEFHRLVRNGYLDLAKGEPKRWRILDASRPMSAVQEELRKVLHEKVNLPGLIEKPVG